MEVIVTSSNIRSARDVVAADLELIHSVAGPKGRWKDATVVVTGCAGFLGFYFMQYLARYGKELGVRKVIGLDTFLLGKQPWVAELEARAPDLLSIHAADISTIDLEKIPGAADARYVIHGASIASPMFYRKYPVETIDANIWGLRRLLDFYRDRKTLEGLLFFSSSEIYGDPDPKHVPTDEEYRGNVSCVGPRACYDESKRFGETMCWIFASQHGMPITVARPFNNYGPGMNAGDTRLPADFAKCVLEGRNLVILSDGSPKRTFCYVADAIAGYFLCLFHGKYDYFNIGIDKPEIMVRELAEIYRGAASELFGYQGTVSYEVSADPDYLTHNPNRRCPVIRKARETLGYAPSVTVEDGVRRYLTFLNGQRRA